MGCPYVSSGQNTELKISFNLNYLFERKDFFFFLTFLGFSFLIHLFIAIADSALTSWHPGVKSTYNQQGLISSFL